MNNIAILVLYYNKEKLTAQCLNSIIKNNFDTKDLFTYDNGSDIKCYNLIKNNFKEVTHFSNPTNYGYSGGFNRGVSAIFERGYDGVLFLTNDTIIHEGSIEALRKCIAKHSPDMVAPSIRYFYDFDKIDSFGGYFDTKTLSLQHYHTTDLPLEMSKDNEYIPGTAFYLTKNSFYKLGGMDETFHTYWEDVDFSFRARGTRLRMVRGFGVDISHMVGKTCHKKTIYTTYYFQRNRIKFAKKHLSQDTKNILKKEIKRELDNLLEKAIAKNDRVKVGYIEEIYQELDSL